MKLSFAEVFETATFYAHFDVVKEGEPDIAPLTIRVCDSLTCAMLGAEKLLHELQDSAGPAFASCARLASAVAIPRRQRRSGHHFVDHATVANVLAAAKARRHARASARICRLRRLCCRRRLRAADAPSLRRTCEGRFAEVARRRLLARSRRRRFSDGAKMARRAGRTRSAADGGQWRRGRARHLQGSLLSRNRSAPISRGHADRRACRGSDRYLHLSA